MLASTASTLLTLGVTEHQANHTEDLKKKKKNWSINKSIMDFEDPELSQAYLHQADRPNETYACTVREG